MHCTLCRFFHKRRQQARKYSFLWGGDLLLLLYSPCRELQSLCMQHLAEDLFPLECVWAFKEDNAWQIALVLVDEVHLLSESRGSALEAGVIGRIKLVSQKPEMQEVSLHKTQPCLLPKAYEKSPVSGPKTPSSKRESSVDPSRDVCTSACRAYSVHVMTADRQLPVQLPIARVRFVAVSATIPNLQDLGSWLDVPPDCLFSFGDEIRPVKLQTIVRGYTPTKTDFLFEKRLDGFLPGIINDYSSGQPSMVFCRCL